MPGAGTDLDRRILAYDRSARMRVYLTVAAGVVAAMLVVAQAWLLADAVDHVFIGRATLGDVRGLLLAMAALALARAAFVWLADVLAQRAASHLKGRLRDDLTVRIGKLGPAFTSGERTGELASVTVQGVHDLDEYIAVYQPMRYLAVIVPALVALVILAVDPITVLILIVTGPMLVLFLALIGNRAKRLTERRLAELGWMSAAFLDLLQGLATLKMFGRSREQAGNVREISRRYGDTTMDVLRTAFETAFVLEMTTTIATALVAVEISLRLIDGGLPFQRALFVLIITPEFFGPLRQLATKYHAGAAGRAAAQRILAILEKPEPSTLRQRSRADGAPVLGGGDLRLERVSFAYDGGARRALTDVSFQITRGERIALVGATGAGKSTVARLLLRFIEPDSGSLTLGGTSLASIDPVRWRSQVAWIPQRPHLFFGTIADNLRLARRDATDAQIADAVEAAHAEGFIERLPRRYDTIIGEQGARLSGGEQQRLAIARAFLKDAPFLVLDEATSNLDADSATTFRRSLDRLARGRTMIIIAHRLEVAYDADRVVMLDRGRVIGAGTHERLLVTCAPYRDLVADYEGVGV